LTLIFVLNRLWDEITNVELFHHGLRSLRMECSKDISHIITSMCEDNSATGVFVPVGYVIDFVLVDNPGILGSNLLLN
jgi:hypothetical protein